MLPLGYLRELGVAPVPAPAVAQGPLEELLAEYRRYLLVERGLSDHTVLDAYGPAARLFLAGREGPDGLGLERLCAADVSSFLARECPKRSVSGRAGSGLRAAVVSALPAPGGADRGAAGVGGPLGRRSAGSHAAARAGASGGQEAVGQLRSAHAGRPARLRDPVAVVAARVCAPARSPRSGWTTSTGGAGCCSFAARAAGMTCCRCRSMSARRSCPIFAAARGASAGRCSCG